MPRQRNITPVHIVENKAENSGLFNQLGIFPPHFSIDAGGAQWE